MARSTIKQKTGICPECLGAGEAEPLEVNLYAGLCQYHKRRERGQVYQERQSRKPVKITPAAPVKMAQAQRLKTIPELIRLAEIVFNKWVRARDGRRGYFICISCNVKKDLKQLQAGHFMPSTYGPTRFHPLNVNGECQGCNCYDPDHLAGYRVNLVKKIGAQAVANLEAMARQPHKWEREDLLQIIRGYKI